MNPGNGAKPADDGASAVARLVLLAWMLAVVVAYFCVVEADAVTRPTTPYVEMSFEIGRAHV